MQGNRYDRGPTGPGYGRDFAPRRYDAGMRSSGYDRDVARRPRRYDAGMRGGYDAGWSPGMGFGREPWMLGMAGPGMFTPFGWDPMMRWSGWDPVAGYVPYQDGPRQWSYGLAEDARRYDHPYYRAEVAHRYGRDYGPPRPVPPRESPLYGRGGDRAVREWARGHGYDVDYTIQPRPRPRR